MLLSKVGTVGEDIPSFLVCTVLCEKLQLDLKHKEAGKQVKKKTKNKVKKKQNDEYL